MARRTILEDKTEAALEWKLRVSPRARYAKLQIRPYGGLEVVIPPRFPRREVPRLVQRHAPWIRRQLAKQATLRRSIQLPREIRLAFDDSVTRIVYLQPGIEQERAPAHDRLVVAADSDRKRLGQLRAWVRARAWRSFPPLLQRLSADTGLGYRKISIRSQKTRWGSCSTRSNISLNDQLLFMPADTVEYLMIHELCHTRYPNHSRAFWDLVARHCPGHRQHEILLDASRDSIPDWFLLDLYT